MAKRRRLIPTPTATPLETKEAGTPPAPSLQPNLTPAARAPVAQVAGEAAEAGAMQEMADYIADARARGLLLLSLPLRKIDTGHLHRDRLMPATPDDDMTALIDSIRARGQQVPVDVVRLTGDVRDRYGLISGMRRITALRHLFEETGDMRFAEVTARVVTPDTAPDAYLSMVEENEIRADISFWERARIAIKAVEAGAYADTRAALRGLYGNVSRAKRSKIGSFTALVAALDGHLRFPTALSEKRGLALAKQLEAPGAVERLRGALRRADPDTAEAEQAVLAAATKAPAATSAKAPAPTPAAPAVEVTRDGDRLILSGPGVDDALLRDLSAWLRHR